MTDLSPAEIARRARPIPTYRDHPATTPADISGTTPDGSLVEVRLVGAEAPALLLFLSASCQGCRDLWEATSVLREALPEGGRLVIVTRGTAREDPAAIAALAPSRTEVVMSSEAFDAYRVAGPPFLVVVRGGEVRTESVAWGVEETARVTRAALEPGS